MVDIWIALLDVDNEVANHLGGLLHRLARHLQRRLGSEVPAFATQLLELGDEVHPQQRLAAAEADTATRGNEIEVVDRDLVVQLLRRVARQPLRRVFKNNKCGYQRILAPREKTKPSMGIYKSANCGLLRVPVYKAP